MSSLSPDKQMFHDSNVDVEINRIKDLFGDVRGMYDFLTMDCEYFLPSYNFVNARWMY